MDNRRRILKIDSSFQNRYILETILISFLFMNSIVIASYFAKAFLPQEIDFSLFFSIFLASCELFGLAVAYQYLLRTSHRVAGPIYVFKNTMKRFGDGDFSYKINLRKNDFFKDMAESINQASVDLSNKIEEISKLANELKEGAGGQQGTTEQAEKLCQALAEFKLKTGQGYSR